MSFPAVRGPGWDVAQMSDLPCLVRFVSGSGQVRYRLGERVVDRYLEFVAGERQEERASARIPIHRGPAAATLTMPPTSRRRSPTSREVSSWPYA